MMKKFIATFILLFISALPAQAHSSLVSSNPAANATVVDFPMDVVPFVYYFTEQDGINGSNMPDFDKTKLIIH